jgi:hypothetical protein
MLDSFGYAPPAAILTFMMSIVRSTTLHTVPQTSVKSLHHGQNGVWIVGSDSVGYLPFEDTAEVSDFSDAIQGQLDVSTISGAFTHPTAKELCVLLSNSEIFAFSAKVRVWRGVIQIYGLIILKIIDFIFRMGLQRLRSFVS